VCVECLIGKQKKPILFKVTEPSSVPYSHGFSDAFIIFDYKNHNSAEYSFSKLHFTDVSLPLY